MKISECHEDGFGTCKLCELEGRYPHTWMTLLYSVEGFKGHYCSGCVEKLKNIVEE